MEREARLEQYRKNDYERSGRHRINMEIWAAQEERARAQEEARARDAAEQARRRRDAEEQERQIREAAKQERQRRAVQAQLGRDHALFGRLPDDQLPSVVSALTVTRQFPDLQNSQTTERPLSAQREKKGIKGHRGMR